VEKTEAFLMKPKVDYAFKEIMMNDEARRGFISAVLGIDPDDIRETRILNTALRQEHADEKLGILDVRVLMNDDTEIDIEINIAYMAFWGSRVVFYESKMVSGQLHPGDKYSQLKKCISISILDFKLFKNEKEYYSCFHLWEDTRRILLTDKIEFHVIELPKVSEYKKGHVQNSGDKRLLWAEFLRADRKEDLKMIADQDVYIGEALKQLEIISQDQQKRYEYLSREKAMRDQLQYEWEAEQAKQQAEQRADQEKQRADQEKQRADQEKQRADQEKQRADQEKQRADQEKQRADQEKQEKQQEREHGIEALVTTLRDLSLDEEAISKQLIKQYGLSPEEAKAKTEQYWDSDE